jgi:hypothetical protein
MGCKGAGRTSRSSGRRDYRVAACGPDFDLAYNPATTASAGALRELWRVATLYAGAAFGHRQKLSLSQ